ncbi:hypothetical protein LQ772_06670 [Frateuria edaphi]|uniref:hypothetical protein n=1 Tax=Frateuria edaphi TaxID=2898793 RepID=UPI001E317F17|nr:hypothetical protein [Frateuria edaphi]UGB46969.1 hypothetical protein LQ772_06670 [Frateuria edaphi]
MQQLSLTFEPGLAQRSRSLRDHMTTRVYNRGLVDVAGQMDLSPSKLTEKLAGADSGGKPRGMTIDELETYIRVTGDISPVHYLVDKYLRDPAVAQQEALAKLASLAEVIPGLMAAAGLQVASTRRAR